MPKSYIHKGLIESLNILNKDNIKRVLVISKIYNKELINSIRLLFHRPKIYLNAYGYYKWYSMLFRDNVLANISSDYKLTESEFDLVISLQINNEKLALKAAADGAYFISSNIETRNINAKDYGRYLQSLGYRDVVSDITIINRVYKNINSLNQILKEYEIEKEYLEYPVNISWNIINGFAIVNKKPIVKPIIFYNIKPSSLKKKEDLYSCQNEVLNLH